MAYTRVLTGSVLIAALAAAPALAMGGDGQRRREGPDGQARAGAQAPRGDARQADRAVPRSRESARPNEGDRRQAAPQRQAPAQRPSQPDRQDQARPRRAQPQREYPAQRQYDSRQYDGRQYDARRYNEPQRAVPRGYAVPRPYYSNRGGYTSRGGIVPRIIRPNIVTIVPYRPYVYRPSFGIGIYYGAGGSYPYGYTPRGYYDPIPGRPYGGLRITDAPREAQVFADGYYIGIVNDFDGLFQHVNLEAGTHRIEIEADGFEPVAFDVLVQPGRTITLRADMYSY